MAQALKYIAARPGSGDIQKIMGLTGRVREAMEGGLLDVLSKHGKSPARTIWAGWLASSALNPIPTQIGNPSKPFT
jgi:hypothetical protein